MGSDTYRPYQPTTTLKQSFGQSGIRNDNNKLDLQLRTMNNRIGSRKVENRSYQANYNLNIGDYVDLNVLAAHNLGKQNIRKTHVFQDGGCWIIWKPKTQPIF